MQTHHGIAPQRVATERVETSAHYGYTCESLNNSSYISRNIPVDTLPISPPANSGAILLVDDDPYIRDICRRSLKPFASFIHEVDNGLEAVNQVAQHFYDVVILDMELPLISGGEVLRRIRAAGGSPHLKVLVLSGKTASDRLSDTLFEGADDYLAKPFSVAHLRARVASAIRLKSAQDRTDLLTKKLASSNAEMELALNARDGELLQARSAIVLALCNLVEQRSRETGQHLQRIQMYCRVLGEHAMNSAAFHSRLSPEMLRTIENASPLHDIGKAAVPDNILNKPSPLTSEEREIMQRHASIGADTLARVTEKHLFASGFFHTAIEIARYHHERWDGTGYPDRLRQQSIPLSARIVAIADVYDALRSPRIYKKSMTHDEAVRLMVYDSPGHFDPALLEVFVEVAEQFNQVYSMNKD